MMNSRKEGSVVRGRRWTRLDKPRNRKGSRLIAVLVGLVVFASFIVVDGSPADAQDRIRVVSLGDSFIAGNGNGNYYDGQGPTGGPVPDGSPRTADRGNCFQSFSSYPWQFTQMLNDSGRAADIWHEACGGATVEDLRPQWERVPDDWQAGADIVLLSFGGNDINFSAIAQSCLVQFPTVASCPGHVGFAEDNLQNTLDLLEAQMVWLSRQTDAHIVVVGYPDLSEPTCGGSYVERGQERIGGLIEDQDRIMSAKVADLTRPPLQNRFHWVPVHEAFAGKGSPCSLGQDSGFINGWLGRDLLGLEVNEVYHPTFKGAQLYATTLFDAGIDDLRRPTSANPTPTRPPTDPSDFDGDGTTDLFMYGPGSDADRVLLFDGGTWELGPRRNVAGVYVPIAGDFNGDGLGDVFLYGPGSDPDRLLLGDGGGEFVLGRTRQIQGTYEPVSPNPEPRS